MEITKAGGCCGCRWQMLAAATYGRHRALELRQQSEGGNADSLLLPPSETMENILSVGEQEDFSLTRLQKELLRYGSGGDGGK